MSKVVEKEAEREAKVEKVISFFIFFKQNTSGFLCYKLLNSIKKLKINIHIFNMTFIVGKGGVNVIIVDGDYERTSSSVEDETMPTISNPSLLSPISTDQKVCLVIFIVRTVK